MDLGKDALHLLQAGPAAAPSRKELGAEMAFQHADAVGDGGRGDAKPLAGLGEAPAPGGGFEEAQAVERRQEFDGYGREGRRDPEEKTKSS